MGAPPDTSPAAATQGGASDAGAPGPARVTGRSGWWIAAVAVVALAVASAWLIRSHPHAPAEAGTARVSAAP